MAYAWKPGYRYRSDAQTAGAVCADLESKGELTAKNLVDVSRPEIAPLHNSFDWDDAVAAESWRQEQARQIIRSLVVVSDVGESNRDPVRAFFSIQISDPKFESLEVIIRNEDKYANLLKTALRELISIQRKYAQIKELATVNEAIDQLRLELDVVGKEEE